MKTQRYGYILASLLLVAAVGCQGELVIVDGANPNPNPNPPVGTGAAALFAANVATPVGTCTNCHISPAAAADGRVLFQVGANNDPETLRLAVLGATLSNGNNLVDLDNPLQSELITYVHSALQVNFPTASAQAAVEWLNAEKTEGTIQN